MVSPELTPPDEWQRTNPRVLDAHLPQGVSASRAAKRTTCLRSTATYTNNCTLGGSRKPRRVECRYVIFHDAQLQEISATKPQTIERPHRHP